jgi:hypothetical protein
MFKTGIQRIRDRISAVNEKRKAHAELPKGMRKIEFRNTIMGLFTFKRLVVFTVASNGIYLFYYLYKHNDKRKDLSMTRWLSRKVGWLTRVELPTFMRKFVFDSYCKFYNVIREDILDPNFENYKSVNDFFIRKIKVKDKSYLDGEQDSSVQRQLSFNFTL